MNYTSIVTMLRQAGFTEPRRGGSWWRNEAERLAAELIYDCWADLYHIHVEPAL
jgi:hypothetical protein